MDIHAFRAGLFDWGPRILSPVEYLPQATSFVDLRTAIEETNAVSNTFFPWCVSGGIGLYSRKKESAGILTRWDIMFRHATPDEMANDFDYFGEQVMGPEVGAGEDKGYENNARFKWLDKEFYYVGPVRLVKARFATRAFSNGCNLPAKETLEGFVKEVDGIGLPPGKSSEGETVAQGYRLFYAVGGNIYHAGFGKLGDYKPEEMKKLWGSVETGRDGMSMTFYPQGDRDKPKDFTDCLKDVPEEFL